MEVNKSTKLLGYARIRLDDGSFTTAKILSDATVWLDDGTVLTAPPEQMAHYLRMLEHVEREEKLISAAHGIMQGVSPMETPYVDEQDMIKPAPSKPSGNKNAQNNNQRAASGNQRQNPATQKNSQNTQGRQQNNRPAGQRPAQNRNVSNKPGTNPTQSNFVGTRPVNQHIEPRRPSSEPAVQPKKGEKKKVIPWSLVFFGILVILGVLFIFKWTDGTIPAFIAKLNGGDGPFHMTIMQDIQQSHNAEMNSTVSEIISEVTSGQ